MKHLITHNKQPVHIITTGAANAEIKKNELESAHCLKKNFQVSEHDKWEVVEVPSD